MGNPQALRTGRSVRRNNWSNLGDIELNHKPAPTEPNCNGLDEGAKMAKPIKLTNRIIDIAVTGGTALILFVHVQFLALPPHFV